MSYSTAFYARTSRIARDSAERTVPLLAETLRPESVLEVGSGGGAWLEAWAKAGVSDMLALDVATREASGYVLPARTFLQLDLSRPFDLARRFSLVQSLEVAEHLPGNAAQDFVDSLCRHGDVVLFSAAPPGQGGRHHINEQSYGYWRRRFAQRGYQAIDWLRGALSGDRGIAWWYRYNMLIYANKVGMERLPVHVAASRVPETADIPDVAPLPHRLRRYALRALPAGLVSRLAAVSELPFIHR
jgi:SAM-dependent methyltransferase